MKINSISKINPNRVLYPTKKSANKNFCASDFDLKNIIYPKNYYLNQISFNARIKPFKSVEEADEYFLNKYGAVADFETIEQAQTLDLALKDFLSKTKIKHKKILKGVEIASYNLENEKPVQLAVKFEYKYDFDDKTAKIAKKYTKSKRFKEFIQKYNPTIASASVLKTDLMLNGEIDWNPKNFEKYKDEIRSKLCALLHIKNSPYDYAIKNKVPPNDKEAKIMQEIGESSNKNKFLEQYVLKKLKGEAVSREATELYREYGGANIFNDWQDYDFAGVQFSSLADAKKYFLEEYGIKADFKNLEQAYVVKLAIDDFLKLDTVQDKKFLEGIEIKVKDKMEGDLPQAPAETLLRNYNCIYNEDVSKLYEKYVEENRVKSFFEENKPDEITVKRIILCLNSDFNWEAKPKGKTPMADESRQTIYHEIGHILHFKNSPYLYIVNVNKKPLSKEEYETMKKVSDYATENRLEFIAEYIEARMLGKIFDNDVVELYRKLEGPNLFHDW